MRAEFSGNKVKKSLSTKNRSSVLFRIYKLVRSTWKEEVKESVTYVCESPLLCFQWIATKFYMDFLNLLKRNTLILVFLKEVIQKVLGRTDRLHIYIQTHRLMRGNYEVRHWDGLRCHDMYIPSLIQLGPGSPTMGGGTIHRHTDNMVIS
jgi:hypothetical protein